jgi:hypothetical protein
MCTAVTQQLPALAEEQSSCLLPQEVLQLFEMFKDIGVFWEGIFPGGDSTVTLCVLY